MTTPAEERPAISAAIILQDGKLLLAQRKVREGNLSWQFPAGEVEAGESAEQAAVRETSEEVGLTVHAVKLLGVRIHPNTGRRMAYVACDIVSGDAHVTDTEELAAVAWVTPPEAKEYVPYGFAPAVEDYLESQGFHS
ncbi:pyrimidine (deoxy)nucleoside triphosphate pyrophosphohydrolase [Microlunatus endophyticus]|uniref:Pyrimidine (Deoxy)nucleoside triphosphate pyrophosphohydrolase n=1 Tax=Microlunatus endophyticus TaxID=1716077 RepID=A0A917W7W3_9ACTN|nr:NUDIX hydrolase [Microlunatus endophyticus]GGL74331.1 pyrimidine (deoxy)nucleoside triphosphate pyrophosphohydrolase [Microlunatus endophyticus]